MATLLPGTENTLVTLLFDKTQAPLAYLDLNFNFILVNHFYAVTNAKSKEYFEGKNYFDLYPNHEILNIFNNVVKTGTAFTAKNSSLSLEDINTKSFGWSLTLVKNNEGQKIGLLLQLDDVMWKTSAEKQLHENAKNESDKNEQGLEKVIEARTKLLQEAIDSLQFENSQRVKTEKLLLKAKEDAEKANTTKSQFLSRMSHELRTPLNAILGFSQLLEIHDLNDKQKSLNKEILLAGNHLLMMIADILDLSVIEEGHVALSISDVSLHRIIEESISLVQHKLDFRNIKIHNLASDQKDISLRADETRIKEVLVNLLTNAVKYNTENGLISVGYKPQGNSHISIYVSDTGKGLTEQEQVDIFEPFNRLGAEYSDIEGVGIGLSISKKLMEIMDGSIYIESEKGKGSTFYLECPVGKRVDHIISSQNDISLDKSDESYNILYVEDNRSNQLLVENFLHEFSNLNLTITSTAEEGLEKISNELYDLIILDINLPGMDGYDALEQLKINAETKDIPVVALSAAASKENIRKGLKAGFNQYLTKPILLPELISMINAELNRAI